MPGFKAQLGLRLPPINIVFQLLLKLLAVIARFPLAFLISENRSLDIR